MWMISTQKICIQFFEDNFDPPVYTPLYGWTDGAQNDIFRSVPFGTEPDTVPNPIIGSMPTSPPLLTRLPGAQGLGAVW